MILFVHNIGKCWSISQILSPWIQSEICNQTLACFTPHINYVATLPAKLKMPLLSFTNTAITKLIYFLYLM